MRSEKEMRSLILSVAKEDTRIRAVVLNGSRVNKTVPSDEFQDFDILFYVENLASFRGDSNWIDVFGDRIILQLPNSMQLGEADVEKDEAALTYLMLFTDFNRIDLRLIEVVNRSRYQDSLSKVLLDKDDLFEPAVEPTDRDYWIKSPSQKEFFDCCNEFWWVTTYVVKGLARDEPLYAKEMLEIPVRRMFLKMISWKVGTETNFSVNLGNSNRFLKKYLPPPLWASLLKTYPTAHNRDIWNSLMEMIRLFHTLGLEVADRMGFRYNVQEAENVQAYVKAMERRVTCPKPI